MEKIHHNTHTHTHRREKKRLKWNDVRNQDIQMLTLCFMWRVIILWVTRCLILASGDESFILQITFHVTGVNLCTIKRYMGHFWLTGASVLIQKTVILTHWWLRVCVSSAQSLLLRSNFCPLLKISADPASMCSADMLMEDCWLAWNTVQVCVKPLSCMQAAVLQLCNRDPLFSCPDWSKLLSPF